MSLIIVKEAIKFENDFFSRHPVYSTLPLDVLGTKSMINSLSSILLTVIKKGLPRIRNEITERRTECRDKLIALGGDFPETEEEQMELVFRMVRNFKDYFDIEIGGKYNHQTMMDAKKSGIKLNMKADKISYQVHELFDAFFQEFSTHRFKICKGYSDSDIKKAIEYYHGDAIPGFPSFDSFLYLVNPKLERLKSPILRMLSDSRKIVEDVGLHLISAVFSKFGKVGEIIKSIFSRWVKDKYNCARRILENLIKCEEHYIFTNDTLMQNDNSDEVEERKKAIDTNSYLVYELRSKVNIYFNIVVRNLRDAIPKVVGHFFLQKINDGLEFEILNRISKKNYCLDLLEENKEVADQRKKLKRQYKVLTNAENTLLNHFGISGNLPELRIPKRRAGRAQRGGGGGNDLLDDQEAIDELYDAYIQYNLDIVNRGRRGGGRGNHATNETSRRSERSQRSQRQIAQSRGRGGEDQDSKRQKEKEMERERERAREKDKDKERERERERNKHRDRSGRKDPFKDVRNPGKNKINDRNFDVFDQGTSKPTNPARRMPAQNPRTNNRPPQNAPGTDPHRKKDLFGGGGDEGSSRSNKYEKRPPRSRGLPNFGRSGQRNKRNNLFG